MRMKKLLLLCTLLAYGKLVYGQLSPAPGLNNPSLYASATQIFTAVDAGASGTAYVVATPVAGTCPGAYANGQIVHFVPNTNATGGATTFNFCSLGAIGVKKSDGSSNPAANDFAAGAAYELWLKAGTPNIWVMQPFTGIPAKSQLPATVVYTDQANTFGNFLNTFQAGGNFLFVAPGDVTKSMAFNLDNIGTGHSRTVTMGDANAVIPQPHTAVAHQFITQISGVGEVSAAQPDLGDLTSTGSLSTLTVTGAVTFSGLTAASGTPSTICQNATTKEITVNAALTCTVSSQDYKQNIMPLESSNLLRQLRPVAFAYRDQPDRVRWGFVSEDIAQVDPRLADAYDASGVPRSLDQNAILALLVKAVQDLYEARSW